MNRNGSLLLTVMMAASTTSMAADNPTPSNLHEQVEIKLHQIEITVSPKNGNLALCSELSKDSFEVSTPNGPSLPIYAIDRAGAISGAPTLDNPQGLKRGPVYIGFFFDLPSLFFCPYEVGDDTVPLRAYRSVREMLASDAFHSEFKPELGDKLFLATFDGDDVRFETGWVAAEEFSTALDALEARKFNARPRVHDRKRWTAYEALANALSDQAETGTATKHVMLLASDFDLSADTGEQTVTTLASVLQRARVVIHPVDLIWDKRVLPSGIGTLSWLAQGDLFGHGATSTDAIEKVIGIYDNGCRIIISIKAPPSDKLTVHLRDKRFAIPAAAPLRPLPPLTNDERFEADIKLPYWGRGLRLESVFWPIKPIGRKTWSGYLVVRIFMQPGEKLPEDVNELMVFGSLNDGRKPLYTSLDEKDIAELRERGSRLLVFESNVEAGTRSSSAVVATADISAGATSRTVFTVPKTPKDGESASWNLVGDPARIAGSPILLPALTAAVPQGKTPVFMGYGCGDAQAPGSIVADATGEAIADVPLAFRPATTGSCGWFLGSPTSTLAPGKYVFKPPQARAADDVRFTIAATSVMR